MNTTFKDSLIEILNDCNIPFNILENIKALLKELNYKEVLTILWKLEDKPYIKENDKYIYLLSTAIREIEEHLHTYNDDMTEIYEKDCDTND